MAKTSSKPKRKFRFRWTRRLLLSLVILFAVTYLGGAVYYWVRSLKYPVSKVKEVQQRTLVFDRSGEVMGHVTGHGENRLVVPTKEVSPNFINALLAREDTRFYQHHGVDYQGVVRAMLANLKSKQFDQGASTLTMQLARNSFTLREKTLDRKLLEVALARRIEGRYSKEQILGFYMSRIYFGSGLYGIERASQGYFMKPASDLSLGEAAMLAGIIRGPSILNPFRNFEDAKDTRDEVLDRMVAEGMITEAEKTAAQAEKISLRPPDQRLATGSYVLQTVYDLLADFLEPEDIELGGLKIYTTIDTELQTSAQKALNDHLTKIENRSGYRHPKKSDHIKGQATKYLQGAVVSIDNQSGAIRALVGGRDFADSSFNRAYQAHRQIGSTFKPFVYAVAFHQSGLLPGAYVSDNAIRIETGGGPVWSPQNSDGEFLGLQPAAIGLIRSRNTMSVRVGLIAGLPNVRDLALALKFGEIPDSPVVFLGAFETTPFTITSAYSTLAAKGVNYTPFLIERIEGPDGKVIFPVKRRHEIPGTGQQIFPESVSWVTSDILGKVIEDGTGKAVRSLGYSAPAYGKTGTTNDYKDAWFVGYTDKLTTGVWVGLDQPKTIMDRGYGSTLAAPVWAETMKTAETIGFNAEKLPAPEGSSATVLCRECGLLQGSRTNFPYQMILPPDLKPRATCRGHGSSLFSNRQTQPQPFPVPGEAAQNQPVNPANRTEERKGFGGALRNFGRKIFGGRREG